MHVRDLVECLCCAHLASHVEAPFAERGGVMVVGAPATLKSTAVMVLDTYQDVVTLSDINAQQLGVLRDAISNGSIRTLVLPELAKLYERHPQTAQNVEGTLQAMTGEGFAAASYEDQRMNAARARVCVIGAMTPSTQRARFAAWEAKGFSRRFLWPLIRLENPHMLEEAVINWELINMDVTQVPQAPMIAGATIPNLTTAAERRSIQRMVKYQPGGSHTTHTALMAKMVSVLRYWYQSAHIERDAWTTLTAFAESLTKEGALLSFREPKGTGKGKRTRHRTGPTVHAAARTLGKQRWAKTARRKP